MHAESRGSPEAGGGATLTVSMDASCYEINDASLPRSTAQYIVLYTVFTVLFCSYNSDFGPVPCIIHSMSILRNSQNKAGIRASF